MKKRARTTRRLEVWLKDTSVALFVLNAHRRLVFFNAGCEQLTGWLPTEVLGQICDYLTETDDSLPASLLASLAPPGEVWRGQSATVPVYLACRNREQVSCVIHFYPLTDVDQNVQASFGIIQHSPSQEFLKTVTTSQRLHAEIASLRQTLRRQFGEGTFVGRSSATRRILGQLKLAQQSSLPLIFIGEAGSGREYMARRIHYASETGQRAFVPLDCYRLPVYQLESTLRRLDEAQKSDAFQPGMLYLDRIEMLSRDNQRIVVDMIESHRVPKVRVVAASSVPPESFVVANDFLSDFYDAITSMVIVIPPLRDRLDDLEPLAQFFLEELNRGDSRQVSGFREEVWQQFRRYKWPGNIRELKAVVDEARRVCQEPLIGLDHLPTGFRTGVDWQSVGPVTRMRTEALDPLLLRIEREQIELALAESRDNKAKAAELLGITRPRLYRRMELLGIATGDSSIVDDTTESPSAQSE